MRYFAVFGLAAGLLCLTLAGHPSLAQSDDAPAADSADDSSADDSSMNDSSSDTDDTTNDQSSETDQPDQSDEQQTTGRDEPDQPDQSDEQQTTGRDEPDQPDQSDEQQTTGRDEPDEPEQPGHQANEPAENNAAENTAAPEQQDTAPETGNNEPAAANDKNAAELDQAAPHKKKPMYRQQIDTANKSTDKINRVMNCDPRLQSLQRSISQMDMAYDTSGVSRSPGSVAAYQAARQAALRHLNGTDAMNANQCSDTTDAMIKQVEQETANIRSENSASGH